MKGPKVLKVERVANLPTSIRYRVHITKNAAYKLPEWVVRQGMLNFYEPDNPRHRYLIVTATDELQAMMRFKRLYAAMMTLREEN